MPSYDYRCAFCGPFVQIRSLREATGSSTCPDCSAPATRVFGAPTLIGGRPSRLRQAVAAAEASAHEPAVATRPDTRPSSRPPGPPRLPGRLAGLPRP